MSRGKTYDQLSARLDELTAWVNHACAQLETLDPGDRRDRKIGRKLRRSITVLEQDCERIRRQMRAHPDAPASG